jgi:hypothetical protein
MVQLTYNIEDNKIAQIEADWIYTRPNAEREIKDGVNAEDIPNGTPVTDDTYYQNVYTDRQWIRESIRRLIVNQIKISRNKQANDLISIVDANNEVT